MNDYERLKREYKAKREAMLNRLRVTVPIFALMSGMLLVHSVEHHQWCWATIYGGVGSFLCVLYLFCEWLETKIE